MHSFTPEEELINRAKQDPEVFGEIYELYFRQIYRYVYGLVHNHPETQDLVSETFIKALRGLGGYKPTGKPFVVWLYRIAKNTTIDHFRRKKREVDLSWLELAGPEKGLEQVENRHWLDQALQQLTEDQQKVIRLHYLEDMKFKDIAQVTNRTEGAVKAMALRAISRLRLVMGKEEVTYGA